MNLTIKMQCPTPIAVNENVVPCGYCNICRQNKTNDWVIRMTHEMYMAVCTYFVTLTYSDANLPLNDEGESLLVKQDLQKFLKRLRKKFPKLIRYFAVGEYGTRYGRAHYHAILFSQVPIDLATIQSTWGLGFVHCGTVTQSSIAYVAKYCFVNKGKYTGRPPPKAYMSRKPGLGKFMVSRLPKLPYILQNGHKKRLPRYYKDLMFTRDEKLQIRKQMEQEAYSVYEKELLYLVQKGYADPVSEYISRSLYANKIIEQRNNKSKFKNTF